MPLNCGVGEDLESPLDCKEIQPVHPKGNQSWVFIGRTDAEAETPTFLGTWCEELTHLKRPRGWENLKVGGEGDGRGWDSWMASLIRWTWVWVNSRSWWWTGKPGALQSLGSQRGGHDWDTELNWWNRCHLYPCSVGEETEAQRGWSTCPGLHRCQVAFEMWTQGIWLQTVFYSQHCDFSHASRSGRAGKASWRMGHWPWNNRQELETAGQTLQLKSSSVFWRPAHPQQS